MIEVTVQSRNYLISSIEIKGHSDSAPYGEDLVCAAVSAIITGGCNAISEKDKFAFSLEEGEAYIKVKGNIHRDDQVVLSTILIQLETIAESYPEFIKIKNILERKNHL